MRVDALMSTPVVTVDADDRLATLRELFQQTGFHHLVVMDAGQVRGIISDRDLLAATGEPDGGLTSRSRGLER